ncbi:MAG: hypothetical protein Q8Q88_03550 [Phenylobacterium sp.]|nr:hypothetical protein [Phenylobacterium sp.]MDP3746105.1 hypothetical protein [Phenylobacterium sp.]
MRAARQAQSVEAAWHVHIRRQDAHIGSPAENLKRMVRSIGARNVIPFLRERGRRHHPDKRSVVDEQDQGVSHAFHPGPIDQNQGDFADRESRRCHPKR